MVHTAKRTMEIAQDAKTAVEERLEGIAAIQTIEQRTGLKGINIFYATMALFAYVYYWFVGVVGMVPWAALGYPVFRSVVCASEGVSDLPEAKMWLEYWVIYGLLGVFVNPWLDAAALFAGADNIAWLKVVLYGTLQYAPGGERIYADILFREGFSGLARGAATLAATNEKAEEEKKPAAGEPHVEVVEMEEKKEDDAKEQEAADAATPAPIPADANPAEEEKKAAGDDEAESEQPLIMDG